MDKNTEEISFKLRQLMDKINECQKLIKKAYLMIPSHEAAMEAEFRRVNEVALQDVRNGLKNTDLQTTIKNAKESTVPVHEVPSPVEEKAHKENE